MKSDKCMLAHRGRVTFRALATTGSQNSSSHGLLKPRRQVSELAWTAFSAEVGPGAARVAPSSLSLVLGPCFGLCGREGAGARSGGLFEVSSSGWWRRVQLTN